MTIDASLTGEPANTRTRQPGVLCEFFDIAAQMWPDAIAVEIPPGAGREQRKRTSYAELKSRSDLLAGAIHRSVERGGVAAILLPRTTDQLYAAQLGALRADSAHLCVDPRFPDDQIRHMLRDSEAAVLLTDGEGAERARRIGYQGTTIRLDRPVETATPGLPALPTPDSVAYLIYTSGTTGTPKGVMIAHQSIANLVSADLAEFALGPGDRVAQGSSAAYDSSIEETWMALASGATVVVMDDGTARLGPDLVPWLRDERITVLCPPPTLLRATGCQNPRAELPDLRLLYVGGEALPEDVANRWAPGRRLVNGYGPTECTVTCLRHDITPGQDIAIGRPVPGMSAWVLDENLEPVRDGDKGELCMAGAGLAVGYLHQPRLNSAKFPQHPRFGRLYRTGDLVHADADGTLYYHGRIDSQVKLRGYRIELEAVEATLAGCAGVREAACRVQGEAATEALAAHVVPVDPSCPPDPGELKRRLQQSMPEYMIPTLFSTIEELPRSTGGKVRRNDLPTLAVAQRDRKPASRRPRGPAEERIARAVREVLGLPDDPDPDDDFFEHLGASSLQAGMLISELRADSSTAAVTVRDLYEARTIAALAQRAAAPADEPVSTSWERSDDSDRRVAGVTAAQTAWLVLELLVLSPLAYFVLFQLLPWLSDGIGLVPLVLLSPVAVAAASTIFTPAAVGLAVLTKKLLIGRYTPTRVPVWSGLYVRMWIVRQVVRIVPWGLIAGTEFQCMALRALGARIGKRVHIHRGVNLLHGGWDLLDIGDDVTISQDAAVRLVYLEQGQVVVGPVTLAEGATLDIRAGVGPHTRVGRGSWLSALSALPAHGTIGDGECWDGVPARPTGPAPVPPQVASAGKHLSPLAHGAAMIVSQYLLWFVMALPSAIIFDLAVSDEDLTYDSLLSILAHPAASWPFLVITGVLVCLALVCTVALQAVAVRALGAVTPAVISRWSLAYIRVWVKSGLVASAGNWLSGGLFWPVWLRCAGMRIARGCEISTIIDVVPELVHIGSDTFLADGIYLGGPRLQRGTVTLAEVHLARDTFLGNHAVIAGGQRLPEGALIGISTVADDRAVRPGTTWFGHPPFELPRGDTAEADRALTHEPSWVRRVNRLFWEWLRFALPLIPMLVMAVWTAGVVAASDVLPTAALLFVAVPMISLTSAGLLCGFVLGLKWTLLGRVRPGTHPLWSCWCSRWDFLYVAWGIIASRALSALEGTLLLPIYLRRMGMKIGERVVLGNGFAQVVDPDMIDIGDGATVNALFQAHTFEDRVLKIDHVRVGHHSTLADGTVPLYGADIGAHACVAPHSVIMKHEHLRPGLRYAGAPTRVQGEHAAEPEGRLVDRSGSL